MMTHYSHKYWAEMWKWKNFVYVSPQQRYTQWGKSHLVTCKFIFLLFLFSFFYSYLLFSLLLTIFKSSVFIFSLYLLTHSKNKKRIKKSLLFFSADQHVNKHGNAHTTYCFQIGSVLPICIPMLKSLYSPFQWHNKHTPGYLPLNNKHSVTERWTSKLEPWPMYKKEHGTAIKIIKS